MKFASVVAAIQLMLAAPSPAVCSEEKGMISISGHTYLAIEAAARELSRRGLKVEMYRISVQTIGKTVHVAFEDPSQSPGHLGSGPHLVGLSVDLDVDTLEVTRSTFSK